MKKNIILLLALLSNTVYAADNQLSSCWKELGSLTCNMMTPIN